MRHCKLTQCFVVFCVILYVRCCCWHGTDYAVCPFSTSESLHVTRDLWVCGILLWTGRVMSDVAVNGRLCACAVRLCWTVFSNECERACEFVWVRCSATDSVCVCCWRLGLVCVRLCCDARNKNAVHLLSFGCCECCCCCACHVDCCDVASLVVFVRANDLRLVCVQCSAVVLVRYCANVFWICEQFASVPKNWSLTVLVLFSSLSLC